MNICGGQNKNIAAGKEIDRLLVYNCFPDVTKFLG